MVTRVYFCKNCDHEFETVQPMHEKLKKKCPKCKKNKLAQDLTGTYISTVVESSNLYSLAEKNTKNMGSYERQAKEKSIKDYDKNIRKAKEKKLSQHNIKTYKPQNSDLKMAPPPEHIKKAIASNDQEKINKYILKGE